MKNKETLEEAAEGYVNFQYPIAHPKRVAKKAFINGAKWQQENSYSEEEVLELLLNCPTNTEKQTIEWFEQFKKEEDYGKFNKH